MDRIEIVCPHCHQLNVRYRGGFSAFMNPRYSGNCGACGADLATGRFGLLDWPYMAMMFLALYTFHIFVWAAIFVVPTGIVTLFVEALTPHDRSIVMGISFALAGVAGIATAERARRKGQMLSKSELPPASVATSASTPSSMTGDSRPASSEVAAMYGPGARVATARKRTFVPWSLILFFGPMFIVMAFSEFSDRRALAREGEVVVGTVVSVGSRRESHSDRRTVTVAFVTPSGVRGKVTGDSQTLSSGDRVAVRFVPSRPDKAEIETEGAASAGLLDLLVPFLMGLAMMLGGIAYLLDWPRGRAAEDATNRNKTA